MTCGIYLLKFSGTHKVYVGKSTNIEKRYQTHLESRGNRTAAKKLLAAFDAYGRPSLEVLLECGESELQENENLAIEIFNCVSNGFNTQTESYSRPSLAGENAPGATISNQTVKEIFFQLLADVALTQEDIANKFNVSKNIVKDISAGISHTWLKKDYPAEYAQLQELNKTRRTGENNKTSVYSNDRIEEVFLFIANNPEIGLQKVSELYSINYQTVKALAYGKNHKWLENKYPEKYQQMFSTIGNRKYTSHCSGKVYPSIICPNGIIYSVDNIRGFAKKYGLNQGHLGAVLRGKETQHKGWRLYSNGE